MYEVDTGVGFEGVEDEELRRTCGIMRVGGEARVLVCWCRQQRGPSI